MNNSSAQSAENGPQAALAAVAAALVAGAPAFLWVPGEAEGFAAVGEGDAPLRVGALGYGLELPLWRPARILRFSAADFRAEAARTAARALPAPPEAEADAPTPAWREAVAAALAAFGAGRCEKVVLARQAVRRAPAEARFDVLATCGALAVQNPAATTFLATVPGGVLVGATPERLAALLPDGTLSTEALAGTAPREADPAALRADPKERAEHAAVVRGIRAALAPLLPPGEDVSGPDEPELRALPTLWHLHTPLRARLRAGLTLLDAARALHPTPAVGGTPREAAAALQRRFEGFDRGAYAGPVGYLTDAGPGELRVALRCARLAGETATLYAGCGLVAGSDAEREWRETALKMRTAAAALRLRPAPGEFSVP